jgi:hypothetical protein
MDDAKSTGFTLTVCTCINEWILFDISVSSRGECLRRVPDGSVRVVITKVSSLSVSAPLQRKKARAVPHCYSNIGTMSS